MLKVFEVYRGDDTDLVATISAIDYDEAEKRARRLGYGKGYRIVEVRC